MGVKKWLNSSEFLRNIATLMTGTVIAQVIYFLVSPVLSRLFNESDFAVFGLFFSITSILSVVACARYDMAVMIPKDNQDAHSIIRIALIINAVICMIFLVIAAIFRDQISHLLKNDEISPWLLLVPVSVFLSSTNVVLGYWFNRNKQYKVIATNKIIRNTTLGFGQMVLGFLKTGTMGLISGQLFGDFLATVIFRIKYRRVYKIEKPHVTKSTIKKVAYEHRKFPMYMLPASFLDTLSMQIPVLLISGWFSATLAGSYFFSVRVLSVPMAFIGAAVAQAFYQKFSEIINAGRRDADKFLIRTWKNLFLIAIIPMAVLFFFGPSIFGFVFGDSWTESGQIASILSPYFLFAFISSPTSTTYPVLKMQNIGFVFSVVSLIYRLSSVYTGYYYNDLFLGLKILVVCEIIEITIFNLIVILKLRKLKKIKI